MRQGNLSRALRDWAISFVRLAHKAEDPHPPPCSEAVVSDVEREPRPRSLACKRVVAAAIVWRLSASRLHGRCMDDRPCVHLAFTLLIMYACTLKL